MPDKLNFVLVEDSDDDAFFLLEALRAADFDPTWKRVENERQFEAALLPGIDIVFSDFSLPRFTVQRGLELLKASNLNVPFIVVSGTIGEEQAVDVLKAGATDYVQKDRLGRLGPVVRRALAEIAVRAQIKQNEAAQRESERRLRQLAENIQEVFWMTDVEKTQMLYVSPAYERIWGRKLESLYRAPGDWMEAIVSEDLARVAEAARTRQITGEFDEIFRICRPDGSIRWIRDRAYPIRDDSGRVYRIVGTAEDITEQRNLEAQLRQAQKLEAIGTLAGGIAHDFNNILGAIFGYAELARLESENNPKASEYLKELGNAAGRARDLVRQILTFSRHQEQERIPVQLRHVVTDALKMLRAATPTTIRFESVLAKETPMILADTTQIHQIIMNLGTNSAHAMRDKHGTLTTILERVNVPAIGPTARSGLKPGIYARLCISDTGHGMSREVLQRILEPFFTTKPPGEGTGLGLSVVHGIVKTHDGWMDVTSEVGTGTTFEFYFPAIASKEPETKAVDGPILHGRGEQILLVEDEEALLRLCQRMLEKLGYKVTAMNNPVAALEVLKSDPAAFALLITDLTMPGMTGMDLATKASAANPRLPIILITGDPSTLDPGKLKASGISEIVSKPFSIRSIAATIRSAIEQPKG